MMKDVETVSKLKIRIILKIYWKEMRWSSTSVKNIHFTWHHKKHHNSIIAANKNVLLENLKSWTVLNVVGKYEILLHNIYIIWRNETLFISEAPLAGGVMAWLAFFFRAWFVKQQKNWRDGVKVVHSLMTWYSFPLRSLYKSFSKIGNTPEHHDIYRSSRLVYF